MPVVGYGHLINYTQMDASDHPNVDIYCDISSNTMLIIAKGKYMHIDDFTPSTYQMLIPNEDEVNSIQRISGDKKQMQFYIFDKKLRIVTFNLGSQIQRNIISGSEGILVASCQIRYPKYKGWSQKPDPGHLILSQCTLNAAQWLANQNADLIGLQEVVLTSLPEMVDQSKYESVGSGPVQFIYNLESLGRGYLISPPDLHMVEISRRIIVVWFPKIRLLAINLHAPHRVNLKEQITNTLNQIFINVNPDRIIMVGDFNDGYAQPLTQIEFLGKILRQHGTPPQSCCADSDYNTIGDYIFDSEYTRGGFYGITNDAYDNLMSDHHPVVYFESN